MEILLRTRLQLLPKYARVSLSSITVAADRSCRMSTLSSIANQITAPPEAGQHILHNGKEYTTIKEGLAYILIPASASTVPQNIPKGDNESQSVFYNPIQQFNRDLSVLAIKAYGEETMERRRAEVEKTRENGLGSKRGKKRKRGGNGDADNKLAQTAVLGAPNLPTESSDINMMEYTVDAEADIKAEPAEVEVMLEGEKEAAFPVADESVSRSGTADAAAQAPKVHAPQFTILDALSATGLRALRYVQEISFTTSVTANDLLPAATATINMNVKHNRLTEKITSITGNALTHMYSLVGDRVDHRGRPKQSKKYDVIDLDPYGTAAPFFDAAVQSVRDDGGLLCVTCTDAGVWASNGYPEKAYSLYGGIPIKGQHSHEGGLRLILHAIATSAARYGLVMEPLLSLSVDFYGRVFVRIRKSPADVKFLAGKTMLVYNCDSGCGAWTTQPIAKNKVALNKTGKGTFYKHVFAQAPTTGEYCGHCGTKTHIAGPMYAGPLHSPAFIRRILNDLPNISKETYATTERIEGMLTMALEETLPPLEPQIMPGLDPPPLKTGKEDPAAIDQYPFFFIPSVLSKVIHCITPHENALRGALRGLGYRVTRSHTKAGSIKTDAPWSVIWEVMREWARQKAPVRHGAVRESTAGWKILGLDKQNVKKEDGKDMFGDRKVDVDRDTVKRDDLKGDLKGDLNEGVDGEDKDIKREIVFDEELGKEKDAKKLVRYQRNPRENWGPMNRAKGH